MSDQARASERGIINGAALWPLCRVRHKGHWTGHRDRLNRTSLVTDNQTNYYREELCAELTASFLCPELGIEPLIDEEHVPYLQHYIQLLEHDPRAFVHACSQAEKAADYLKCFQQPD